LKKKKRRCKPIPNGRWKSYIGYSENLKTRNSAHNNGEVTSTKAYRPLDLIHYEAYKNEKDAKRIENYFKTTKGKITLKIMLKEYFIKNKE